MAPSEFEQLERRVAQPDESAFSQLHRAYERVVHYFIVSKINNPRLADEITKKTFERAWEHVEQYRWQDWSFHVWIMRIAQDELKERGYESEAQVRGV